MSTDVDNKIFKDKHTFNKFFTEYNRILNDTGEQVTLKLKLLDYFTKLLQNTIAHQQGNNIINKDFTIEGLNILLAKNVTNTSSKSFSFKPHPQPEQVLSSSNTSLSNIGSSTNVTNTGSKSFSFKPHPQPEQVLSSSNTSLSNIGSSTSVSTSQSTSSNTNSNTPGIDIYKLKNGGQIIITDTKGDGHCFYRSVYNILKNTNIFESDNEDDAVFELREYISEQLDKMNKDNDIIDQLCEIYGNDIKANYEEIIKTYPFFEKINNEIRNQMCDPNFQKQVPLESTKSKKEILIDLIKNIIKGNSTIYGFTYAGELEKTLLDRFLKDTNIRYFIITDLEYSDNKSSPNYEDAIIEKINEYLMYMKNIRNLQNKIIGVIIHTDDKHYRYLSFKESSESDKKTLIDLSTLRKIVN